MSAPVRRFVVVCFGFARDRLRRQPWHVADGIAAGLSSLGHQVTLVTDAMDPPENRPFATCRVDRLFERGRASPALRRAVEAVLPDRVFVLTGALRLARMRPLELAAPVSLVLASPRLHWSELARLSPASFWRERHVLTIPLLETALPGRALAAGFRRSRADSVVYLSDAARQRYARAGLPVGQRLVPQVTAALPARPRPDLLPTVAYLGPALDARGADLAVAAFEQAVERGLRARLLLLLRPDGGCRATARLVARCAASPCRELIACETRELPADELRRRIGAVQSFLLPFRITISDVPLVVIEAGLSGRPLVVLDTPGVSEIARAFGGIVAAAPEALPAALIEACRRAPIPVDATDWTRWDEAARALLEPAPRDARELAMIALLGVDGSGKTRLADLLRDRLARGAVPHRQVWSRFRNYLSKPLLAVTRLTGHNRKETVGRVRIGYHDFAGNRLLAWAFLALQTVDLALDIAIRFRLRRRGTIVADRCALDSLVDIAVDTGLDDVVLDRLAPRLVRLLPQPLLAVVVERPAAQIAAQRPDAMADRHFARRRALYARLAERLRLPVLRNDASLEAAIGELSRLVAAPAQAGPSR
jgi:glycosyltransferase involved in cell wall biosynthesis/thymidylate kinase